MLTEAINELLSGAPVIPAKAGIQNVDENIGFKY